MDMKISLPKNSSPIIQQSLMQSSIIDNNNNNSSSSSSKQDSIIVDNLQSSQQQQYSETTLALIEEFQHFKLQINEHLRELETLLERFKSIIRINYPIDRNLEQSMMNKLATSTTLSATRTELSSTRIDNGSDDIRTVLTDIDQHLSILKEIEQRNSFVCESFSREIRSRDEALLEKMRQINMMNHELATMQAKIQHLIMKNSQLENEIKYFKTASSFTNTEASSTPVGVNDLERIHHQIIMDQHHHHHSQQQGQGQMGHGSLIGCQGQPLQPPPPPSPLTSMTIESKLMNNNGQSIQMERKASEPLVLSGVSIMPDIRHNRSSIMDNVNDDDDDRINDEHRVKKPLTSKGPVPPQPSSSMSRENDQQKDAIYHDLLLQYRKIEQLIQQGRTYKVNDYSNNGANSSLNVDDDDNNANTSYQQQQSMLKHVDQSIMMRNIDGTNGSSLIDNDSAMKETEQSSLINTPATVVEVPLMSNHHLTTNQQDNQHEQQQEDKIRDEQKSVDNNTNHHNQHHQQSSVIIDENEDVVATSIKAYEHFVKMQHDLETLMKKENEYRNRIVELEQENQRLDQKVKDDEFSLSDVQYELDILKHNYELEIESFSTAINERESLIEKLQQKMQSLKGRYVKLDERLKASGKTEIELQARIEELEGRLKYEELKEQTLIDSRLNEMKQKLDDQQHDYQVEINNLKTDLACAESVTKELRSKIDELETSLKNMASAEFEDEFVYYKNQIDNLVKELDKEKQERQRQQEQFEQTIRLKDKHLDQAKEQMKKEKDSMIREKTEYEQRFRKMMTKMKSKETEIKQLQEKVMTLNEKFKPQQQPDKSDSESNTGNNNNNSSDRTEGQLMAELALNEIKLSEMTNRLDDQQEQLKEMGNQLENERQRRRQLETFYLNSLNNHHNGDVDYQYYRMFMDNDDTGMNLIHNLNIQKNGKLRSMDFWQQDDDHHHYGSNNNAYHPYSQSSLALSMDDIHQQQSFSGHNDNEMSFSTATKRWLRRQKNILLFGQTRSKVNRLIIIVYLILIHYLIFLYYYSDTNQHQANDDNDGEQQFIIQNEPQSSFIVQDDDP
uniref:Leucine-rich repeat-containing protein DDB_G0290503 n=1 Tax=Dermatophagoides pteronyssinus TaxID=6956 RepID=A0A6P6XP20_DERPT|nr:putative leucine-rich repeat-containing protein DDB_G0290503 [Dermatophagoides pteronyssinus]